MNRNLKTYKKSSFKANYSKKKNKKIIPYIETLLVVFILILFITAHYLHTIDKLSENMIWAGSHTDNLMTDFVLYLAIFLTVILFILIIHRNFIVRGRRKRK